MKKYEAYKDSGVEWIGEIPEHWEVKRLKYIKSDEKNSFVDGPFGSNLKTDHFVDDGDAYVIDSGFVTSGSFEIKRDFKTITLEHFETIRRSECTKDDIIISKIGANFGMSGILPQLDKPSVVSGNSLKLTINRGKYDLRLIHLQLLNLKDYGEIDLLVKGSAQPALSMGAMSNLPFVLPNNLMEQTIISNYLDHKTSQLDTLISKKEKLIELLQEERTAIINHAVTKGLPAEAAAKAGVNPNVPMKDSGIEWLGEIPEHWEVKRVKHVTNKIGSGVTPKGGAEIYQQQGIPLLRSQNVYFDGFRLDDVAYISDEIHNSMSGSKVYPSDVLLNITGGSIGRCFYVTDEFPEANVNQHVCIVRPNEKIETVYLYNLLRSHVGQHQIEICQSGGNRESLNFEQLKNFSIPLPSIKEQNEILKVITKKEKELEEIIHKSEQEIELLKEYKTALISEVVTGKVDVRNEIVN